MSKVNVSMETPTMERLNTLFDENERDQIRIDDYWRTAEMWSFKEEGHLVKESIRLWSGRVFTVII